MTLSMEELEQRQVETWCVYMIRDKYDSIYTGITNDLIKRINAHKLGKGAKALRGKAPLQLAYESIKLSHKDAARLEYKIKQLSRVKKLEIIKGKIDPVLMLQVQSGP